MAFGHEKYCNPFVLNDEERRQGGGALPSSAHIQGPESSNTERESHGCEGENSVSQGGSFPWVIVGKILTTYATKGALKIESFTENPKDLFGFSSLVLLTPEKKIAQENCILSYMARTSREGIFIGALAGVSCPQKASLYRHYLIGTLRNVLPVLPQDQWYIADLIQCPVKDAEGVFVGSVVHVCNFGAGNILEIQLADSIFSKPGKKHPHTVMVSFYQVSYIDGNGIHLKSPLATLL